MCLLYFNSCMQEEPDLGTNEDPAHLEEAASRRVDLETARRTHWRLGGHQQLSHLVFSPSGKIVMAGQQQGLSFCGAHSQDGPPDDRLSDDAATLYSYVQDPLSQEEWCDASQAQGVEDPSELQTVRLPLLGHNARVQAPLLDGGFLLEVDEVEKDVKVHARVERSSRLSNVWSDEAAICTVREEQVKETGKAARSRLQVSGLSGDAMPVVLLRGYMRRMCFITHDSLRRLHTVVVLTGPAEVGTEAFIPPLSASGREIPSPPVGSTTAVILQVADQEPPAPLAFDGGDLQVAGFVFDDELNLYVLGSYLRHFHLRDQRLTGGGTRRMFAFSLDVKGKVRWVRDFGSELGDDAHTLSMSPEGELVALASGPASSRHGRELRLFWLNLDGEAIALLRVGSVEDEHSTFHSQDMRLSPRGDVVVSGTVEGSFRLPDAIRSTLEEDVFLLFYPAAGEGDDLLSLRE